MIYNNVSITYTYVYFIYGYVQMYDTLVIQPRAKDQTANTKNELQPKESTLTWRGRETTEACHTTTT